MPLVKVVIIKLVEIYKFKRERWRPLAIEQDILRKAENYVKNKYRYSNEKCLLKGYRKNK